MLRSFFNEFTVEIMIYTSTSFNLFCCHQSVNVMEFFFNEFTVEIIIYTSTSFNLFCCHQSVVVMEFFNEFTV